MKKLLSLLSVLTISGNVVPTTIAASPYQKEEIKFKSGNINYLQANNFKNLNRNKRDDNNFKKSDKKLIIDSNDPQKYKYSLNEIINYLIDENIIESIFESENRAIYMINNNYLNSNHYLILPVSIINNETRHEIELVIRLRDFYIVGFINIVGNFQENIIRNYYWLLDSDHPNLQLEHIDNTIAADISLGFDGHYNILLGSNNSHQINWSSIQNAFITLSNWTNTDDEEKIKKLKKYLGYIILITSESLRFRSIFNLISNNIVKNYSNIYWNPAENNGHTDIRSIVTNWQSTSNNIIDAINNIQARFGNSNGVINESFYNLLSQLPMNTIAQALANTDVRVILGLLLQSTLNCYRKPRNINNNLKNEYCDAIKDQNEGYNLGNREITAVKILNENTKGGTLQSGDIYVGTTSGVYLWFKRGNEINLKKFDGLDYRINDIILDGNGSANVKANGLIYHLNLYGWGHTIVHDEL